MQEIRVAARGLLASPLFTLACVITLALGIGAATALFSLVDAVLVRPLPYPDPDRLVRVFGTDAESGEAQGSTSLPDYLDWQRDGETLESIAGFMRWSYNLAGEGPPQRVWGGIVTGSLFTTMGVEPLLGRTFTAEEDRPGGERVVVLSHGLWRSLFAGAPDTLGRRLRLDNVEHSVVGVMPPGFEFPSDAQLWTPFALGLDNHPRGMRFLRVVARLAPGVSLGEAQAEMSAIAQRLSRQYPDSNAGVGVRLQSLREQEMGDVQRALWVLMAAAALVLLIACSNVVNLMLARFADRRGEMALRRALGASRLRLFVRCLADALLLTAAGGALGVLLAHGGVKALAALHLAQQNTSFLAERLHDIPRLAQAGVDGRVLSFALLISLATALAVSLLPALQLSERHLSRAFAGGEKGSPGLRGRLRLRHLFVVLEVAVALSLVIGAGLLIRSFASLTRIDPGFRSEDVTTLQLSLPVTKYLQAQQTAAFYTELIERAEAIPEVDSAGITWGVPLSGTTGTVSFEIEGRPAGGAGNQDQVSIQPASGGYFRTLGIPLLRGRLFTGRDDRDAPPVVVVNETMARRFWPGEDPLGKRVTFTGFFGPVGHVPPASREIVGVVGDTRRSGLAQETEAEMYFPYTQATWRMMTLAVHASSNPVALGRSLQQAVWAIDGDIPASDLRTMDQVVARSISRPRFNTVLLALFAGAALLLAIVGVYGVVAYSVSTRTHEIGIHMALGAKPQHIVRQVLRQGLMLTASGLLLGIGIAFVLTRALSALLFGISPTDPMTFAAVSLALLLIAGLASYYPARSATRVDPLVALRDR